MNLIQMSLSAAALIAAITILRAIFLYRLPKRTFMVLWGLVLLRLLIPVSIPSDFSVYSWAARSGAGLSAAEVKEISSPPVPSAVDPAENFIEPVAPPEVPSVPERAPVSPWLVVWGIGFALSAGFFLAAYLRMTCLFRAASPVVGNAFLQNWLKSHPLRRRLSIRRCEFISAPLSYGLFRPVILLPELADRDDPRTLDYILTHEYAHIRHFDILWKAAMILALCIHWFNPLVWVMFLLFNRDIELVCDETVLKIFGEKNKSAYAHVLIDMEIQKNGLTPICNHFNKNGIEERIVAIMNMKKKSFLTVVFALLLMGGFAVVFATSEREKPVAESRSVESEYASDAAEGGVIEDPSVTAADFSAEDIAMLNALRFAGYASATVSEFQKRVRETTDTPAYQDLLARLFRSDALYERIDLDETASFAFEILEPLTGKDWRAKRFNRSFATQYPEASDNALIEVTLTLEVRDADALTVGEYDAARAGTIAALNDVFRNKTSEALRDDALMREVIRSEIVKIKERYDSEKLLVSVEFAYRPLSGSGDGDAGGRNETQAQEKRMYPNASREDYRSLLTLKTADYQDTRLNDFNRRLLSWANEDDDRAGRINEDISANDFVVSLSGDELSFLKWTVFLSGLENAEAVKALRRGAPVGRVVVPIELPSKSIGEEDLGEAEGACREIALFYRFAYQVADGDAVTVRERDRAVERVVSEIARIWNDLPAEAISAMSERELFLKFSTAMAESGDKKITFALIEDQFGLGKPEAHRDERTLPALRISVDSAAADFLPSGRDGELRANYDPEVYTVEINERNGSASVRIFSKIGDNRSEPVRLYIPTRYQENVLLAVKNASVDLTEVFSRSNVAAVFENSNIDFRRPFKGSLSAELIASSVNFSSAADYRTADIELMAAANGTVEVPEFFEKAGNRAVYFGGADGRIVMTLDGDSVAAFE